MRKEKVAKEIRDVARRKWEREIAGFKKSAKQAEANARLVELESVRKNSLCNAKIERSAMQSKRMDQAIAKIEAKYTRREMILQKFMQRVIDSGNFDNYEKIQMALDKIDEAKRKEEKEVYAMYGEINIENC